MEGKEDEMEIKEITRDEEKKGKRVWIKYGRSIEHKNGGAVVEEGGGRWDEEEKVLRNSKGNVRMKILEKSKKGRKEEIDYKRKEGRELAEREERGEQEGEGG